MEDMPYYQRVLSESIRRLKILVLNAGSSSQKCSLFDIQETPGSTPSVPMWSGQISWKNDSADLVVERNGEISHKESVTGRTRPAALRDLLSLLWSGEHAVLSDSSAIDTVGHRIVHGGEKYESSTLITENVKSDIKRLSSLAPLHQPANLEGITIAEELFPVAHQVAVFDTSFHRSMAEDASVYAGPYDWYAERGIRRYGFHGISHAYAAQRTADVLKRSPEGLRIITCHLGNGSSLAAVKNGKAVATTMGFTPLEGLVMGTRCGSIDPGVLMHLLQEGIYDVATLHDILIHESGLKGISGVSHDLREIERSASRGNGRARLAIEIFVRSLTWHIAALVPDLNGLDALVFTAGIGENSGSIRLQSCSRLAFLGVEVDEDLNRSCRQDCDIASGGSAVRVVVIHSREDWMIALECFKCRSF